MRMPIIALIALTVVFTVSMLSAPVPIQSQIEKDAGLGVLSSNSQKGGEEETGPYEVVSKWPQPFARQGYIQGSQGGVFAESPNRIFIANRGEIKLPEKLPNNFNGAWGSFGTPATGQKPELRNCIIIVDANGKLIESWTQWDKLFEGGRGPHAVKISPYDPERNVWVVDDMRQQVFKFSNDGKKLMTWGTPGTGQSQFDTVHSIAIDKNRRLYVSDRGHSRIQIFDENGKFLDMWPNIRQPYHIMMSVDQYLWVADGVSNKFLKYDLNGKLLYSWGTYGTFPGAFWGVNQFSVDPDGNLYTAETFGGRTQKYRPARGADPARLIKAAPLMGKASN